MMSLITNTSPVLIELLIKSLVIIAIGYAFVSIFRRASSEWQHRLLIRVFAVAILFPLVLVLPRWEILPSQKGNLPPVVSQPVSIDRPTLAQLEPSYVPLASEVTWHPSLSESFLVLWLLGCVALLLRTGIAGARLRRFAQSCSPPSKRLREIFSAVEAEVPTRRVSLHLSDQINSPFSAGWIRPSIHLPESADTWEKEDLEMIFRHELAHIRRHDALAVFLSRIFLALNWINPLAWLANGKAIQLREQACDELVIAAGHEPTAYAEMLFRQASHQNDRFLQTCATSMAETGTIEQRIQTILKPGSHLPRRSSRLAKTAVTAVTLLFLMVGFVGSQTSTNEQVTADLETTLKETILPSVDFRDASLGDALKTFSQMGGGLNMILQEADAAETKITLRLSNVPLGEALRYATSLAQFRYRVDGDAVIVEPIDSMVKEVEEGWEPPQKAGDGQVAKKLESIIIPSLEFNDTPVREAIAFLVKKGVELDTTTEDGSEKGFNVILDAAAENTDTLITLRLNNVPISEALRYTTALAQFHYRVENETVVVTSMPPVPKDKVDTSPEEGNDETARKLKALILPRADFNETPLPDVLEFLQQRSVELDSAEKDVAKKGFNIILDGGGKAMNATVTLNVSNVSFENVFRDVSEVTGFEFSVESGVVVFRLKELKNADGSSVLDSSMIVYGSSIADGHEHAEKNLPILLAGRGSGTIKAGQYLAPR